MSERWRVGEHYGIHVYAGDRPVATFHTVADAKRAVEAVNEREELTAERDLARTVAVTLEQELAAAKKGLIEL
jgi:hypothetical protein